MLAEYQEQKRKEAAIGLIDQIIAIEKVKDADYVRLLAKDHIIRHGESAVEFHLKALKELIEKL